MKSLQQKLNEGTWEWSVTAATNTLKDLETLKFEDRKSFNKKFNTLGDDEIQDCFDGMVDAEDQGKFNTKKSEAVSKIKAMNSSS